MNKALCILMIALCFGQGFGKDKTLPEMTRVMTFYDLESTMLDELIKGEYPETAVEFRKGMTIPVQFIHNTEIFGIDFSPKLNVIAQKTCYFRVVNKKVYISFDLENWESAKRFFNGKPKVNVSVNKMKRSLIVESNLVPEDDDVDWDW